MSSIVTDFRSLQKACYDLGIKGFTGEDIKPVTRCNRRKNLPVMTCWCYRDNGQSDPCPEE